MNTGRKMFTKAQYSSNQEKESFLFQRFSNSQASYLSMTAIIKVKDAMVLIIDVTNVGEVYLRLAKYMLKVKPPLFSIKRKKVKKNHDFQSQLISYIIYISL